MSSSDSIPDRLNLEREFSDLDARPDNCVKYLYRQHIRFMISISRRSLLQILLATQVVCMIAIFCKN